MFTLKYKQKKFIVLNCIYNFGIGGFSCLPGTIALDLVDTVIEIRKLKSEPTVNIA